MFQNYLARYRGELLESVVPFWLSHSVDREYGGYFTCLDRNGKVYDTRKYVWLQGRAVWTFSRLYNQVEQRLEWLEAAACGINFLRRHAFDPLGRPYFSLTREGRPAFFQRKPYGAVFAAAGVLEYAKAVNDSRCCAKASICSGRSRLGSGTLNCWTALCCRESSRPAN